jgi:uncharacterized cupin superfamily protein
MLVPRIYADKDGGSHFADSEVSFSVAPTTIGLPDMQSSDRMPAATFQLIMTTPSAVADGWHPTPLRQFVLFLKGSVDIQTSDGEVRHFEPGSMLFVEDTTGKGHLNHKLNDEELLLGFVAVPDNFAL